MTPITSNVNYDWLGASEVYWRFVSRKTYARVHARYFIEACAGNLDLFTEHERAWRLNK